MLEKGIVYRRQGKANWCTGCMTVIANEQVVDDNLCERCSSPVRREGDPGVGLPHHRLRRRPAGGPRRAARVARAHHHHAAQLDRAQRGAPRSTSRWTGPPSSIRVFTTRVDTIFGCTYVVLAPEHPLTAAAHHARAAGRGARPSSTAWRGPTPRSAPARAAPKEGVFTGAHAVNPFTRREGPGLDRQLRAGRVRHRRGHERPGPRPARLRVRAEVRRCRSGWSSSRPRGRACRPATGSRRPPPRTACSSTRARSPACRAPRRASACRRSRSEKGFGEPTVKLPPARLGLQPAALLGHAHPHRLLRRPRRGPGSRRPAAGDAARRGHHHRHRRAAARQGPGLRQHHLPDAAASRRGARPRPWTPSWTRPGTTPATSRRATTSAPSTRTRRGAGCRSTSTWAVPSTP